MVTRRTFVLSSSSAVVAGLLARGGFAQQTASRIFSESTLGAYTQGLMTRARFEPLIGSLFMAFLDDHDVCYMHLTAVKSFDIAKPQVSKKLPSSNLIRSIGKPIPSSPTATNTLETFAAVFETGGKLIPQGSYVLDHGTMGRFTVFLVPGQDQRGNPTASATFTTFAGGRLPQ